MIFHQQRLSLHLQQPHTFLRLHVHLIHLFQFYRNTFIDLLNLVIFLVDLFVALLDLLLLF